MPHTWIVWGIYAQYVHSHIATQEMSAVRKSLTSENFHIFNKDCENTFNMSAEGITPTTLQN